MYGNRVRTLPGKREPCFDDAVLKTIVFTGLAAALLSVAYGWYRLRGLVRDTSLPAWRKATSSLGLFAVTAQALMLIPIYVEANRFTNLLNRLLPRGYLSAVILLFLVAVPFILTGKGSSRWWLSTSSVCLFAFWILAMWEVCCS
jgi:hypothetical protein